MTRVHARMRDLNILGARSSGGGAEDAPPSVTFVPTWVTQVDLAAPVEDLCPPVRPGGPFGAVRVLVKACGEPLGFVEVPLVDGVAPSEDLMRAIRSRMGASADRILARGPEEPRLPSPDGVSVVVCTRDRAESLRRTLQSILELDGPEFEVVVVDNAPRTSETRDVIDGLGDPRLRYVFEPRKGLSRARNRGIREARGEILAFTDDDVLVDRAWLVSLLQGFARAPHVRLVTGLVPAAELETAAQAYFDHRLDWAEAFDARLYDLGEHRIDSAEYPYSAGIFGAGANFAISRRAVEEIGLFDEALGAGTPSRGGEDLDYFLRVILQGDAIAYEPRAVAWHFHRAEDAALVEQMYGYGSGLTAYLFKHVLFTRGTPRALARRLPMAVARWTHDSNESRRDSPMPAGAQIREIKGLVAGPLLYVRGRVRVGRS